MPYIHEDVRQGNCAVNDDLSFTAQLSFSLSTRMHNSNLHGILYNLHTKDFRHTHAQA